MIVKFMKKVAFLAHFIQSTYNLEAVNALLFLNGRMSEVPRFIILIQSCFAACQLISSATFLVR